MAKVKLEIPATMSVRKVKNLLNERPDGMDFEEYKELRRAQSKWLRSRLRGVFVWKSKGYPKMDKDGKVQTLGETWGTAVRSRIPQLRFV